MCAWPLHSPLRSPLHSPLHSLTPTHPLPPRHRSPPSKACYYTKTETCSWQRHENCSWLLILPWRRGRYACPPAHIETISHMTTYQWNMSLHTDIISLYLSPPPLPPPPLSLYCTYLSSINGQPRPTSCRECERRWISSTPK